MLYRLAPPYARITDIPRESRNALGLGDVLVLGFSADRRTWDEIASRSNELQQQHLAHPLAFWGKDLDDRGYILLAELARDSGVRAVIRSEEPENTFLSVQLAGLRSIERDVPRWLVRAGIVRDPRLEPALVRLLELTGMYHTAERVLRELGIADRTARSWFARSEELSPGKLVRLARTLRLILKLQRDAGLGIAALADAEWSNHRFQEACVSLFGAAPGSLRNYLGFEPLLAKHYKLVSAKNQDEAVSPHLPPSLQARSAPNE